MSTTSPPNLTTLYDQHDGKVSDKWSSYLSEYQRLFADYRLRNISLLEIGVQNGGSLELWQQFFPNAKHIVGCDVNPHCRRLRFGSQAISLVVGNADSDAVQAAIRALAVSFNLIVDDGSHRSGDIIGSFARYFPCLQDGGLFVVEDLHCSYWQEFEGGLFEPFSSMAFFKRLADVINHEHWGVACGADAVLSGFCEHFGVKIDADMLRHIHAIEFTNSMCVVRKSKPQDNVLGLRFVAGTVENVVRGHRKVHLTPARAPAQVNNEWSVLPPPPDQEFSQQRIALQQQDRDLEVMRHEVVSLQSQAGTAKVSQDKQTAAFAALRCQADALRDAVAERNQQIDQLNRCIDDQAAQLAIAQVTLRKHKAQIGRLRR